MSGDDESGIAYPQFHPRALKRSLFWATPTANSICGFMRLLTRIEVTGSHRVGHGPLIIAPYHASKIDPLAIAVAIWREGVLPHFLAKSSIFKGAVGRALVTMGQIPVLRASMKAGDSLIHAKNALEAGQTVVIYPQGTLTKDPELWPQPSKTGVSRLAIETGVPVVPVGHWGLQAIMPVHSKGIRPRPFSRIRVRFGEPIIPPAPDADGHVSAALSRQFADRVTAGIAQEVAALRGVPMPQRYHDALRDWAEAHPAQTAAEDTTADRTGTSADRTGEEETR